MASLIQSTIPLFNYNNSQSSTSNVPCFHSRSKNLLHFQASPKNYVLFSPKKRNICMSTLDDVSAVEPAPKLDIGSLKVKLLSTVSGLNKGPAASEDVLQKADAAAKEVEEAGGPVDLAVDLEKLQGKWKLVYSSALGGAPTGVIPVTVNQVFQRIDILSKDLDNIVELELGAPWPLPPVEVTATLAHKFELIGSSTVKIIFEKTTLQSTGNLSQLPPLELEVGQLPEALRPPTNQGSGEFDVTYVDSDTRITRGDRGELRVFVIS